jgi:hypothetical protein
MIAELTQTRIAAKTEADRLRLRRDQKAKAVTLAADLKKLVKTSEKSETAALNAVDSELADVLRPTVQKIRDVRALATNPGQDLIDAIVLADFMPTPPDPEHAIEREIRVYQRIVRDLSQRLYKTRRDYSAAVSQLAETVDGLIFHIQAMHKESLPVEPELDALVKAYRELSRKSGALRKEVME